MSWQTPQEHIATHCRGGKFDREKSVAENISERNLQCLIGMAETGEATMEDFIAVGGLPLATAIAAVATPPKFKNR